jgi:hypothetical protein
VLVPRARVAQGDAQAHAAREPGVGQVDLAAAVDGGEDPLVVTIEPLVVRIEAPQVAKAHDGKRNGGHQFPVRVRLDPAGELASLAAVFANARR